MISGRVEEIFDEIFKRYSNMEDFSKLLSVYSLEEIQELNDYVSRNYRNMIGIRVDGYEFMKDKIILKTELGSFLLDRPEIEEKKLVHRLSNLVGKEIDLSDFFGMLIHNNIFYDTYFCEKYDTQVIATRHNGGRRIISSEVMLEDYLKKYFIYRMLLDSGYGRKLFYYYNRLYRYGFISDYKSVIPLEYLNSPNFNYYIYTSSTCAEYLMDVYDHYYCFDKNLFLVFSLILVENRIDKVSFIMEHKDEFKEFILEEATSNAFKGSYAVLAYTFLKDNNLLSLFTEEELKSLYMSEPKYSFKCLEEFILPVAKKIKNTSPMVRLDNNSELMVHIQYHDYDLYDNVPIAKLKTTSVYSRNLTFLEYFLCNNEMIVKLYKMYYKSYQKAVQGKPEKNNLEDFIRVLFQPKNLLSIYNNRKFDWEDLNSFSQIGNYYGEENFDKINQVMRVMRNQSLKFYNAIVLSKDNPNKLDDCVCQLGLDKKHFYEYIIQDKFLYSKEKSGLLSIASNYYGDSLRMIDILVLLDEMVTREMTLDEILREKEISKKDFQKIYDKARENNPILYQCIFESLSKNKRRGYLKLVRLGYKVLNTRLSSLEEYEEIFGSAVSFSELLFSLEKTELYSKLLEKAVSWEDYCVDDVKKRRLEKKSN